MNSPDENAIAFAGEVYDASNPGNDVSTEARLFTKLMMARAIMAEREACEKRAAELLLNPAAVYVNWLRGSIDARSIIADEREACAQLVTDDCDGGDDMALRDVGIALAAAIRDRGAVT